MSQELIRKAQKGDYYALNELIEKHKELAFSIAIKYLKNKEDAEDVTQNAFVIVFKSISKFRNESKFSTWLYKIIYHECIKELKSRNRKIEYLPQYTLIKDEVDIQEPIINVENLLKQLKPNEYMIISLFYLKEKSINEISQITSFTKSNIKVILHRSRAKLNELYNLNYR